MTAGAEQLVESSLRLGPSEALHYWTLGERTNADGTPRPALILLHGMRDVGRSLLPVAHAVCENYFCVLPDLRGHGKSFKPGAYAIQHFLMDLRRLHQALELDRISLLGHSLGGHIVCRYAGLFPMQVDRLVIVEGLGPPRREMPATNEITRIAMQLQSAITTAEYAVNPRLLASVGDAAARLRKNNPRLDIDWALQLAHWGTTAASTQGAESTPASTPRKTTEISPESLSQPVRWSFDPRAQEVFLGVSDTVNFEYWRAISARTLVVMGSLGHEYWGSQFPADGYSGRFQPGELEERLTAIGHATHLEIADAGHQVHYDQPQQLAAVTRDFLYQTRPPTP